MNRRPLFGVTASAGALLAVLAAGCVRFAPQPITPSQSAAQLGARSLNDAGLRRFLTEQTQRPLPEGPLKRWDLPMLSLAAAYYHPSLALAQAQARVAEAGLRTAGARPNPVATFTPEYNFSAASAVSPWLPGIGFEVPIETAGKRGYRTARARALAEAARLRVRTAAWRVHAEVRTRLVELTAAAERGRLLRQLLEAETGAVELLEQRLAAGAVAQTDVTPMRVLLGRTRLELATAESQAAEARTRLAEAIGVSVAALEDVDLSFSLEPPAAEALTGAATRQEALQRRSEVLATVAEYAAAQAALQLEIARQYPDVQLGPGYQWDQGEHKWAVGLRVELPLLNRNQGPIAGAEARRAEVAAQLLALQARVIGETELALAQLQAAHAQTRAGAALLAAQRAHSELVESQFRAGAADQFDRLTARIELATVQIGRLESLVKAQQATGALEAALERPLAPGGLKDGVGIMRGEL